MKARKLLSIALVIVLSVLTCLVPTASAASAAPLIVVNGFFSTPLYLNYGTDEQIEIFGQERLIGLVGDLSGTDVSNFQFDPSIAESAAGKLVGAFISGMIAYGRNHKSFDKFSDTFIPTVEKYFGCLRMDENGRSVDQTIGYDKYPKAMSNYTDEQKESFMVFGKEYAEKYGEDKVFNFTYDWRYSTVDIAEDFKDFVNNVLAQTGSSKVNVVAVSMGSIIIQSYLSKYGSSKLNNVVYASPAWLGTSIAGDMVNRHIQLDDFAIENYLVQLSNVSAVTHIAATVISSIATWEDLTGEYLDSVNKWLQGALPRIYSDFVIPVIGSMPGIWSLVPHEQFESGIASLYPDGRFYNYINPDVPDGTVTSADPACITHTMLNADGSVTAPVTLADTAMYAKLVQQDKIQQKAADIIAKNAKLTPNIAGWNGTVKGNMRWGIVCGYNRQIAPINEKYEMSDGVVDTKYLSGGATCARYLQAFNDWDDVYNQKIADGHNHLSWDYKIDASTCMFPENVWFIKNMDHMGFDTNSGTTQVMMWLLDVTKTTNIHTDEENYPQFFMYNTYKRVTVPKPGKRPMGDINGDGVVTTKDAILALKMSAGTLKPTEEQLTYGDYNENGKIEIADARAVLCIATKIPVAVN